jgi:aconitate hydratase
LQAALLAKNANLLGLKVNEYIKTTLSPGSKVVPEYLEKAGLMEHFEALGFY